MSLLYRYVAPACPDFNSVFRGIQVCLHCTALTTLYCALQHSAVLDVGATEIVLHKASITTLANAASFILEK